MLPPPGLETFLEGGTLAPHRVQEARMVWSATRRQLAASPSDIAAAERLIFLTAGLRNAATGTPDEANVRALLEGALEVMMLPRHRQFMRGHLARTATKAGQLAHAEAWLAGCDPSSEDLVADSAYRVSGAFLATAQRNPNVVLQLLGGSEQEVPVDDAMDPLATVLRANGWEKLGNLDGARAVLTTFMGRGGHAAAVESVVRAMPPEWNVCAQSFGGAQQQVRDVVGQRAASSGGGALIGYIVMGASVIPVLMLVNFIVQGMFFAPMLAMLIFPAVFGTMGWRMVQTAKRSAEIARDGRRGRGVILGISPTGTRINGMPMMRIDVQVQVDGHMVNASVNRLMMGDASMIGREVPVIWHPKYPTDVVLEV
jgi:hypothetical protein